MGGLVFLLIFGAVVAVASIILAICLKYSAPATAPDPPPIAPVLPSSAPVPPSAAEVEMIEQLARHSYHGEQDSECAVCHEAMAEGDSCIAMPICGHVFHGDCLQTWLMTAGTCPLCRGRIS